MKLTVFHAWEHRGPEAVSNFPKVAQQKKDLNLAAWPQGLTGSAGAVDGPLISESHTSLCLVRRFSRSWILLFSFSRVSRILSLSKVMLSAIWKSKRDLRVRAEEKGWWFE